MGLLTNNWGMMDYNYEEMASESKLNIIRRIIDDMKPYLNQRQISELNHALMINLEDVDTLQGRSKDSVHNSYFMESPEKLKDKYCEFVECLII